MVLRFALFVFRYTLFFIINFKLLLAKALYNMIECQLLVIFYNLQEEI